MFWTKKKQTTNSKDTNNNNNNNSNKNNETNILEPPTVFSKFDKIDYIDRENLETFEFELYELLLQKLGGLSTPNANAEITLKLTITPTLFGSNAYLISSNSFVYKNTRPSKQPLRLKKPCRDYIKGLDWEVISEKPDGYCLLLILKGYPNSRISRPHSERYNTVADVFSLRNEFIEYFNKKIKSITLADYSKREFTLYLNKFTPFDDIFAWTKEDLLVPVFLHYMRNKSRWYFDYSSKNSTVKVTWKNV